MYGTGLIEQPVREIRPGDHAAFSFATTEEQAHVIGPFLDDGLEAREKVIYLSDARPRQLPGLGRRDADRVAATGQLRVIPRDLACRTRGRFDPERMHAVMGKEIAMAVEEGYHAIRVTSDMTWALADPDGLRRMLACEAGIDRAIGCDAAIIVICQLNRTRCPPDELSALTSAHHIQVTANPDYDDGVLRITRSHAPNGLRLSGELDAARHDPLQAALISVGERNTEIHLDFADVRFLDLGTLSLLVTHTLHTPPGRVLVLDNLPDDVAGVIQTLGWHHLPGLTRGRPRPS